MAGLSETNGFGKKRIMIVDHNEEEQKTVKKMLGEEYEVLVAETGLQALGYMQDKEIPHLILLDGTDKRICGKVKQQDEKADHSGSGAAVDRCGRRCIYSE